MTAIAPHIAAFLRERLPVQRGASEHTCESYAYTFQLLFQFASHRHKVTPSKLQLEQIDAPLVTDFLEQIEVERGNSPRTRNTRLAAIRSFMRFCEYRIPSMLEQSRRILAIPLKRTDIPLITHLSMAERQDILNSPDVRTRGGIRDRAMLHLCFSAGLRVSELIGLPLIALTLYRRRVSGSWAKVARSAPCRCGSRPLPICERGWSFGATRLFRSSSSMPEVDQ